MNTLHVQRRAAGDEFAQRLVQRRKIAANADDVAHFPLAASLGHENIDAVFMHVQTDYTLLLAKPFCLGLANAQLWSASSATYLPRCRLPP